MANFTTPTRVWINALSTLQPPHKYHGKTGIAHTNEKGVTRVYFEKGNVYSMEINPLYLETKNSHANVFEFDK